MWFPSKLLSVRDAINTSSKKNARARLDAAVGPVFESLENRVLLTAVVHTNQGDYSPGSTAIFTAGSDGGPTNNFKTGEMIEFHVTRTDGQAITSPAVATWDVTDGVAGFSPYQNTNGVWVYPDTDGQTNGAAQTDWHVDPQFLNASLKLSATGLDSGEVAKTTFTDSLGTPSSIGAGVSKTATSTTLTFTLNTSVAVGNTVLVAFVTQASGTVSITDNATGGANIYSTDADIRNTNSGGVRTVIFSAPVVRALSSGSTITVTYPSGTNSALQAFQVSGLVSTAPKDVSSTNSSSGTSLTTNSVSSTTQSNELIFGAFGYANNSTFSQGGTSTTLGFTSSGTALSVGSEWRSVATTGNYSCAASIGTTAQYSAAIVTYKVAAPAATTTTLTRSVGVSPSTYGDSLTFHAVVNNVSATGTVQFKVDGSNLGSPVNVSGGVADLTTTAVGAGSARQVTAVYSGDGNFATSTSAALSQTVNKLTITASATSNDKIYDRTTAAASLITLSVTTVNGDVLTTSFTTALFTDKNVGLNKTVNITGIAIGGTPAANYTLSNTTASTTASIAAKTLTVTATGVNRVYDADTDATVTLSDNRISGDVFTLGYTSASFADKTVGNGKTVTVNGVSATGTDAGNYNLHLQTSTLANITAVHLTVSGITAASRDYDTTTTATIDTSSALLSGVLGTDTVTLDTSAATGAFATKTVGTGKTVTIGGLALGGTDAANYTITAPTTTADITAVTVDFNILATGKIYDGNAIDTVVKQLSGVLPGDTVSLTAGTSTFSDKNVGTAKTVTTTGVSLTGPDAGNYLLSSNTATDVADITARTLTITATATSRVYDTTDIASVTLVDNHLAGDSVTVNYASATFDDKTVGNGKTVTVSGINLTGADAGNYAFASSVTTTANITAASLTVTGITAVSRPYDRTTVAAIDTSAAVLSGVISPDDVSLDVSAATGAFADKNVALAKVVTINGLALTGADAGNYIITLTTTTADITNVTVTGSFTSPSKIYDGTTAATISAPALTGIISGDVVTLAGGTATFSDKNVAAAKTVTGTGFTLGGADAGNYVLASTTITTTADITARTLSITGHADRVYDTTTNATVTFTDNRVTGDLLTISYTSASFADKNVGTAKTVTIVGTSVDGDDVGNYTFTIPTSTTANITAAPVTVTGITAANKIYDGTTTATIDTSAALLAGVLGSDDVSLNLTATGAFANKTVGTGKVVTVSGLTLAGGDAGNYAITATTTTANITALALTVTGITASSKVYDGTTAATINTSGAALVGVLSGDTVTLTTTGATGAFSDRNVAASKTVTVNGLTLSGTSSANYTLAPVTATGAVGIPTSIGTANSTATDTSLSVTVPAAGVAVGNTVFVTFAMAGTGTAGTGVSVTDSKGNVYHSDADLINGTAIRTVVFSAPVTTALVSGNTITVTYPSNSDKAISVFYLNGITLPVDKTAITSGSSTTPLSPTTTTTSQASEFLLGAIGGAMRSSTNFTVGSGYTALANSIADSGSSSSSATIYPEYRVVNATGTYSAGMTLDSTRSWVAGILTYKLASGTAPVAITARALTVTATGVNRVYDTTTNATVTISDNRVSGDTLNLSYTTATFADKTVANAKTVSVTGISVTGTDAGNYTFNTTASTTANVTKATLTVTGTITAANKVYDQTTTATLNTTGVGLAGVLGADVVTFNAATTTGAFSSAAVGTGKTVTITVGLTGADAGNYSVTSPTTTANITAKSLTVSGITASSKIYDGTTAATINTSGAALVGVISGDTVTLITTGATGAFSDRNVAASKTVTVSGLSLGGTSGGNYTLAPATATAASTFSAPVSIGTANSTSTNTSLSITVPAAGVAVGNTIIVTFAMAGASGTVAVTDTKGNAYHLDADQTNSTAIRTVVFSAPVTAALVSGNSITITFPSNAYKAVSAFYVGGILLPVDKTAIASGSSTTPSSGNTATTSQANEFLLGAIGGQMRSSTTSTVGTGFTELTSNISIAEGSSSTTSATIYPEYRVVNATGAYSAGATLSSSRVWVAAILAYKLAAAPSLGITARPITVTAATNTKTYDGTTSAAAAPTVTSGAIQTGDTSGITESYATANAGTGLTLAPAGLVNDGNGGSNYTVTFVNDTTGAITAAAVTVTANPQSKLYGATDPTLTFSGTLFGTDTFTGALSRDTGENVGVYAIGQGTLSAGTNYAITFVSDNLTITPAALTVTADNQTKVYGDNDPALTYTVTGLVLGDTPSIVTGVTLSTTSGSAAVVGAYVIEADGGTASNYTVSDANGTLTVTPASLTVTADDQSKVYGATDPTLTYTPSGTLFYSDDYSVISGVSLATVTGAAATGGTHAITASGGTASNYNITFVAGTLTVSKAAALTITADDQSKVYGAADPTLTYTPSGTLYYGDTFAGLTGITVSTVTGSAATAGAHDIIPSGSTTNYDLSFVNGTLTVTPASLTVSADNQTKVYGATDPTLTYTVTGLVYSDDPSVVTGVSLSTTTGSAATVGTFPITASGGIASNYTITDTDGTLTVTPASLTVTADDQSKVYGAADSTLTYTPSGTLFYSDDYSVISGVSLSTVTGAAATAGTHAITISGGTAANYNITFVPGTLTVAKAAALTVTADDKSEPFGGPDPSLTYTVTGTLFYTDDYSVVSGVSLSTTTGSAATVGQHAITATGGIAANYNVVDVNGTLTVTGNNTGSPLVLSGGSFYLKLDGDGLNIDVWSNATGTGSFTQTLLSQVSLISVTGSTGDDTLTVDLSAGNLVPSGGVNYDGGGSGANGDTLAVIGSSNADTITIDAGTINVNSATIGFSNTQNLTIDPGAGADTLAVNAGAVTLPAGSTGSILRRHFASLTVASGASLTVAATDTNDRTVLDADSFSVSTSGSLDLNNNDLIVRSGDVPTITSLLASGSAMNSGGHWNGPGIKSSIAANDAKFLTSLGMMLGNSAVNFDNQTVGALDVLVKYTYYGDANLDGQVDGTDYTLIDTGAGTAGANAWQAGNFNFDNSVDGSDYSLIDNAFNQQSAPFSTSPAPLPAALVSKQVAVPAAAIASAANESDLDTQRKTRRPSAASVVFGTESTVSFVSPK